MAPTAPFLMKSCSGSLHENPRGHQASWLDRTDPNQFGSMDLKINQGTMVPAQEAQEPKSEVKSKSIAICKLMGPSCQTKASI